MTQTQTLNSTTDNTHNGTANSTPLFSGDKDAELSAFDRWQVRLLELVERGQGRVEVQIYKVEYGKRPAYVGRTPGPDFVPENLAPGTYQLRIWVNGRPAEGGFCTHDVASVRVDDVLGVANALAPQPPQPAPAPSTPSASGAGGGGGEISLRDLLQMAREDAKEARQQAAEDRREMMKLMQEMSRPPTQSQNYSIKEIVDLARGPQEKTTIVEAMQLVKELGGGAAVAAPAPWYADAISNVAKGIGEAVGPIVAEAMKPTPAPRAAVRKPVANIAQPAQGQSNMTTARTPTTQPANQPPTPSPATVKDGQGGAGAAVSVDQAMIDAMTASDTETPRQRFERVYSDAMKYRGAIHPATIDALDRIAALDENDPVESVAKCAVDAWRDWLQNAEASKHIPEYAQNFAHWRECKENTVQVLADLVGDNDDARNKAATKVRFLASAADLADEDELVRGFTLAAPEIIVLESPAAEGVKS